MYSICHSNIPYASCVAQQKSSYCTWLAQAYTIHAKLQLACSIAASEPVLQPNES